MTFDEYINSPNVSKDAKEAAIKVMNGFDTPGRRWLMDRFKIRPNPNKKGNIFEGTKYEAKK